MERSACGGLPSLQPLRSLAAFRADSAARRPPTTTTPHCGAVGIFQARFQPLLIRSHSHRCRTADGDPEAADGDPMLPYAASYRDDVPRVVPGYHAIFDMAAALLSRGAPKQGRLLVVGSGDGQEILVLSRALPTWRVTGVDPSPSMVALAEGRLRSAGCYPKAEIVTGTVDDLPRDRAFDAATCVLVLHFEATDSGKLAVLRGIADRLKPGGVAVVVDMCGDVGDPAFVGVVDAWMAHALAGGMGEEYMGAFRDGVERRDPFALVSEGRMEELMAEAGFRRAEKFFKALLYSGWIACKD